MHVSVCFKVRVESFTCQAPRGAAGKVRPLQKITSDDIHKSGEIFVRNPIPGKVGRSMEGRARGVARGYFNFDQFARLFCKLNQDEAYVS